MNASEKKIKETQIAIKNDYELYLQNRIMKEVQPKV